MSAVPANAIHDGDRNTKSKSRKHHLVYKREMELQPVSVNFGHWTYCYDTTCPQLYQWTGFKTDKLPVVSAGLKC